jgi:transposase
MMVEDSAKHHELIGLRNQAHFWRTQHARAVRREAALKQKVAELEVLVRAQEKTIQEQAAHIEALTAKVIWLQGQVFGRKSEQSQSEDRPGEEGCGSPSTESGRPRGQQVGAPGHGRRNHAELSVEVIEHGLPEASRRCSRCGRPYEKAGTVDSEEVHWEVRLVRRIHRRQRYAPTCWCEGIPRQLTAPVPPKLIPKGMFSIGFWVQLLLEKYLHQRPLYRILQALCIEGLRRPSQGTITGGLERIGELVQPLYALLLERSRGATHWHMDETRWLVFEEREGKKGYRYWLWVVVTQDTCVYILDPSRSASVPRDHLGPAAQGIISADRYSAYKALGERLAIAYCWTHVRRDYIRLRDQYKKLSAWAQAWVDRIDHIYRINNDRLAVRSNSPRFELQDRRLRKALADMAEVRDQQLADEALPMRPRKALQSLREHWPGLLIFVDHPEVPMDNNESERRLRLPVVGRKNYYGSGALWSGTLSALLFSIFQTLLINQINPKPFLLAYFEACAHHGGRVPANLDEFLPWNLSAEKKAAWRHREDTS